jgi:predicted transcriptional regulator
MKTRKQTVRIQLVVSREINKLLNSLAEKERRTRSVIAELALQAYAPKADNPHRAEAQLKAKKEAKKAYAKAKQADYEKIVARDAEQKAELV